MADYLNSVFAPEIIFEKFLVKVKSETIGILRIQENDNKPIVCLKNDGVLKEAEIYYRYNSRSEKIKYAELGILFEQVKQKERKSWMEHFEKISKIGPENATIFNLYNGEISGKGGMLIIDKKLVPKLKFINEGKFHTGGKPVLKLVGDVKPVSISTKINKTEFQITDDLQAPEIRLAEEEILKVKYPLDYGKLTTKMRKRYSDFKMNQQFHNLRKKLMQEKGIFKKRYLDPENLSSVTKDFYSSDILKKFDKHYKKIKKEGSNVCARGRL